MKIPNPLNEDEMVTALVESALLVEFVLTLLACLGMPHDRLEDTYAPIRTGGVDMLEPY